MATVRKGNNNNGMQPLPLAVGFAVCLIVVFPQFCVTSLGRAMCYQEYICTLGVIVKKKLLFGELPWQAFRPLEFGESVK